MKIAITTLLIILVVLACGCTATAPAATPAASTTPATPDLRGTWLGTMLGYEENLGFTDYGKMPIKMVVTDQQGRLFSGYLKFGVNSSTSPLAMAGVIGRDGKTFTLVENTNGYTTGELIGTDTMEMTHADDAEPYSVALDTLKRV